MSIKNFFGSVKNSVSIEKEIAIKSSQTIGLKKKADIDNKDNKSNEDNKVTKKVKVNSPNNSQSEGKKIDQYDNTWIPFETLELSWANLLKNETTKTYYKKLDSFLTIESMKHTIYPSRDNVFTAFNLCSYNNVKVVIIGQGESQAHGLSFSVLPGNKLPPSLRNIVSEAKDDVGISTPSHGNLESWAKQGVLMLNVNLSVKKNEANSHQKKGWEEFTDAVVKCLAQKEGLVYLLWGLPAASKCKGINNSKNCIITTSHPSPLGAYKTNKPFMKSKCFSRCNVALIEMGKEPIDWNII